MPRTGISRDRIGARVRIGRVNDGIDHTPYIFQEEGIIQRVGTPEEIKRGIIGYTARGVVTMDGLKRVSNEQYQKKIKELEKKKKDVSPITAEVYEEAKQELSKFANQVMKAKEMGGIIPFSRANEALKQYVDFKVNVLEEYNREIEKLKSEAERANKRQKESRDRWETLLYRRERDGLKGAAKRLQDFYKKSKENIQFGEDIEYYPPEQVVRLIREDAQFNIRREWDRIYARKDRALARERFDRELEQVKKDYPNAFVGKDGGLYAFDPERQQTKILYPAGTFKT